MATYKQPQKSTDMERAMRDMEAKANRSSANTVNMTVGNISRNPDGGATKTSGVKIRGTGAATKGTMARGPMA